MNAIALLLFAAVAPPAPKAVAAPAPAPIKLETPKVITSSVPNRYAGMRPTPGCNCRMCTSLRMYGNGPLITTERRFNPTPRLTAREVIDACQLTPQDVLYDLGSGDGRLLIYAARDGARAVGLELEPELVAISRRNIEANGVGALTAVYERDATTTPIPDATVVTLFQDEPTLVRLKPILERLKSGCRVVSYAHAIPGWPSKPWRKAAGGIPIYRWRIESKTVTKRVCGVGGCRMVSQIVAQPIPY